MAFASFPLDSIGLTPHQIASCSRAGLSLASDILLPSPTDLNKKLHFSNLHQVTSLVDSVAKLVVPKSNTMLELLAQDEARWLSTGDEGMDLLLGGGLRLGTLTEIVGESASGKSHLSMSLALSAQLSSLSRYPGGAIILTSERELSTDRLIELSKSLLLKNPAGMGKHGNHDFLVKSLLDNVHTNRCLDVEGLDHALSYVLPAILSSQRKGKGKEGESNLKGDDVALNNDKTNGKKPIRLLILDSITALLRGDDTMASSTQGLTTRSRHLSMISDKLKSLAVEYDIAIVVINQVSDVFFVPTSSTPTPTPPPSSSFSLSGIYTNSPEPPMVYSTQSRWFSGQSDALRKEATLGIVWANIINVRIMLSRTGRRRLLREDDLKNPKRIKRRIEGDPAVVEEEGEDARALLNDELRSEPLLIRRMNLVFSPFSRAANLDYVITSSGIHSIPGSYQPVNIDGQVDKSSRDDRIERREAGEESTQLESKREADELQQLAEEEEDEYEVFDDLGDLPAEYWEGKVGPTVE
ncbi:DNA repair protein RAD57, partial [Tremellales sp. Uapishka_1]